MEGCEVLQVVSHVGFGQLRGQRSDFALVIHFLGIMDDTLCVKGTIFASLVFVGDIDEVDAVLGIVNKVIQGRQTEEQNIPISRPTSLLQLPSEFDTDSARSASG